MKVLVLNCGSSSIKYQLFEMPQRMKLAKGVIERIGDCRAAITHQDQAGRQQHAIPAADHEQAMVQILTRLLPRGDGRGDAAPAIGAVGHRVVHGGDEFTGSVLIDPTVLGSIDRMSRLAPLHNPPNLAGIRAAMQALPHAPQVACFDTAFHATIPQVAYTYALPFELYEKLGVRRYGFHGTSHRYVAERAAELLGSDKFGIDCITCHLGNGSSMTAVKRGRSVETSMGLTPLEGLVMGTRCGDIDPAIVFYLAENGYSIPAINELCNKKSGVLGISGCSNDLRTLIDEASRGHERARLALDVYCYRVKKYIGAYLAVLGRIDALVFTGGIGENAAGIRQQICAGLEPLGIELDCGQNEVVIGREGSVHSAGREVSILVIPTDEEGAIAADTYRLVTA